MIFRHAAKKHYDSLIGEKSLLAPIGTKESGYAETGPYHCEDCIHMDPDGACRHPFVMADPELKKKKLPDGRIKVDPEKGCCTYVRPGAEDHDEDDET